MEQHRQSADIISRRFLATRKSTNSVQHDRCSFIHSCSSDREQHTGITRDVWILGCICWQVFLIADRNIRKLVNIGDRVVRELTSHRARVLPLNLKPLLEAVCMDDVLALKLDTSSLTKTLITSAYSTSMSKPLDIYSSQHARNMHQMHDCLPQNSGCKRSSVGT